MKEQFIELITNRLRNAQNNLKEQFFHSHPIKVARHFALDQLLPIDLAEKIYNNFPKIQQMKNLKVFGELKMKYSHIKHTDTLLQDLHHAIQDPRVIALIEEITEIKKQLPDKSRIAGGVSALLKGHYINPHLDSSHDIDKKFYRTVNLLYYVSPNWKIENGGNYELWDQAVENRIEVPSLFNRLLVMETNQTSWHAVNPVRCEQPRYCVFNYYFSEQSPLGDDYYHGSSLFTFINPLFRARPEQTFLRALDRVKKVMLPINAKNKT